MGRITLMMRQLLLPPLLLFCLSVAVVEAETLRSSLSSSSHLLAGRGVERSRWLEDATTEDGFLGRFRRNDGTEDEEEGADRMRDTPRPTPSPTTPENDDGLRQTPSPTEATDDTFDRTPPVNQPLVAPTPAEENSYDDDDTAAIDAASEPAEGGAVHDDDFVDDDAAVFTTTGDAAPDGASSPSDTLEESSSTTTLPPTDEPTVQSVTADATFSPQPSISSPSPTAFNSQSGTKGETSPPVAVSEQATSTNAPIVSTTTGITTEPIVQLEDATREPTKAPVTLAPVTLPPRPDTYRGAVQCPGFVNVFGYTQWNDLVYDVNHFVVFDPTDWDELTTFTLCPQITHDATKSHTLHIQDSYLAIVCGRSGLPDGCIIDGVTIRVGDQLQGIVIQGLEFTHQQGELFIGDASHVRLDHCRFTEAYFPGTIESNKRAAVVSAGYLKAVNCLFARNIGQGAVLVTARTAVIEQSSFRSNRAAPDLSGDACDDSVRASAIQVGLSGDMNHAHNASLQIRDSCFDNNVGSHIVRVQPGATVVSNRRNAVLNTILGNATCNGIFILRRHANNNNINIEIDEACQRFAYRNMSCTEHSQMNQQNDERTSNPPVVVTVSAPVVATPVTAGPPVSSTGSGSSSVGPPTSMPTGDFLSAFAPTNGINGTTINDDDAIDDDSTDDDDATDDDDSSGTETEDDAMWLDNVISTLEQNETSDDAIVPLTDNFDLANNREVSTAVPPVSLSRMGRAVVLAWMGAATLIGWAC